MKVFVAGGSGLVGSHLREYLKGKYEVINVSRDPKKGITYEDLPKYLDDGDVVINLAGENISKRWNKEFKERLVSSRVQTGRSLVEGIRKSGKKPRVFIQASAVGYYGRDREETFTEDSLPKRADFLTEVVKEWENSSREVEDLGIRRVITRLGVVLSKDAKAFKLMVLPVKFFVGGILGDGKQWMSWIHIEDVCRAFEYFIENEKSSGIYNLTSPYPVTNADFMRALARKLKRPLIFRVPPFALRLIMGEVADYIALEGQRVIPKRLLEEGFKFKYALLDEALEDLLK
jgi:uncharacterized protein (TIGR01777 family)